MRLEVVEIDGFRSIARRIKIRLGRKSVCLIGPNEHGKSNILAAIDLLDDGELGPLDRNTTTNDPTKPAITYHFSCSPNERKSLGGALGADVEALGNPEKGSAGERTLLILRQFLRSGGHSLEIVFRSSGKRYLRIGSQGLLPSEANTLVPSTQEWLDENLPGVLLFESPDNLRDCITLQELDAETNIPFEGLLKLADVWEQRAVLFEGTLQANKLLMDAGRTLTRRIRRIWTQGARLRFQLFINGPNLCVRIEDPTTFDVPSVRSLGFRSFLSFYLTLYARTLDMYPEGYIILFDEPGLHLHPQGQKDLLREIRKLSEKNQVVYATHSPFMIDRNDLPSTLLVQKGSTKKDRGTHIHYKPYGSNWRALSDSLGIVPSDAFFPPEHTLLVEGTSDRVYIACYMRILRHLTKADLNYLYPIDADRRAELPGLVSMLLQSERKIVVLADGDRGGDDLGKHITRIAGKRKKQVQFLNLRRLILMDKEVSIEDALPENDWFGALQSYVDDYLHKHHELDIDLIREKARDKTMGAAASEYFEETGLLESRRMFSKTSVAHILASMDLSIPEGDHPIARICEAITKSLDLR